MALTCFCVRVHSRHYLHRGVQSHRGAVSHRRQGRPCRHFPAGNRGTAAHCGPSALVAAFCLVTASFLPQQNKNQPQFRSEYNVYSTFQSHEPEFDYLKSLEIEEKINKIRWLPQKNAAQFLLSTNGEFCADSSCQTSDK